MTDQIDFEDEDILYKRCGYNTNIRKQAEKLRSCEMKEGWMKNDIGWMKN